MLKHSLSALALALPALASASSDELVMAAPLNATMPFVQFHEGKLSGGILKDLGQAIAARLGRQAVFVAIDGNAVSEALSRGKVDGICYVLPHWIDGNFHWSRPLIPDAELVASQLGAPVVRSLTDLRDRPVGTVDNYRYPRVERVLGLRFQRTDSPTMEENLRKLMAGEVHHTVIGKTTLAYQTRQNAALKLRADLVFSSFNAQCAFSRDGKVAFSDINTAIDTLIDDGSVDQILARYR
jgi:ABC-type amino acid transport substrate-binding protein